MDYLHEAAKRKHAGVESPLPLTRQTATGGETRMEEETETNGRSRNWVFTWNNYTDAAEKWLEDYANALCKYMVYGYEIAPETGTPHLQGQLCLKDPKTLNQVAKKLGPGPHLAMTVDLEASIVYCKKGENFQEYGSPPMTPKEKGEKEVGRWQAFREAAERGAFQEIPEKIRFHNIKLLEHHHRRGIRNAVLVDTTTTHEWYYGVTGTGKSRKARGDFPLAYLKGCNKWWDSYEGEDVVIIEDFDKKHDVLVHHLKIWADRYPFPAEVKGGMLRIRPLKIIVTSNYHPSQIWVDTSDLEPMMRRFAVTEFTHGGTIEDLTSWLPDTPVAGKHRVFNSPAAPRKKPEVFRSGVARETTTGSNISFTAATPTQVMETQSSTEYVTASEQEEESGMEEDV